MRLRPVRLSENLQGKILLTLLETTCSTEQLARELRRPITRIRRELIHLHHLGIIRMFAEQTEEQSLTALGYDRNYLWEMTVHGREHGEHHPRCAACLHRERRLRLADEREWT
jgi:hypothetical protein